MGTNPTLAGFTGLTRFSGRDRAGRFWPYAGVVFVIVFLAMGLVMSVVLAPVFGANAVEHGRGNAAGAFHAGAIAGAEQRVVGLRRRRCGQQGQGQEGGSACRKGHQRHPLGCTGPARAPPR